MKKTAQLNVAVTEELFARIERLETETGIKGTEMGRMGLVEIVNRLEQSGRASAELTAEDLARLAKMQELAALRVDVDAELERLLETAGQPVETGAQG